MAEAVSIITDIATDVLTLITGNTVLMTFFCAGLLGIAISYVKRLK